MMPAQEDLRRDVSALPNPFEDTATTLNAYTAREIATLQSRLDKQLGPEFISSRPGAGGAKVYYLAAEKAINLANEVFGFNGWSSAIKNVQIDFVDEDQNTGKISLGVSIIVRVTLRDGTFHEDIGYGHIENCKGKAAAFEKAKKEAATDAMKRALRNFGNILGNCLYDRQYLQRVTKVKSEPSRWDADNLHRHHDHIPIKKEPARDEAREDKVRKQPRTSSIVSDSSHGVGDYDEFGADVFDGTDMIHTDEIMLDTLMNGNETSHSTSNSLRTTTPQPKDAAEKSSRTHSMPVIRPPNGAKSSNVPDILQSRPESINLKQENGRPGMLHPKVGQNILAGAQTMAPPPLPNQQNYQRPTMQNPTNDSAEAAPIGGRAPLQQPNAQRPGADQPETGIGFISSRAAEILTKSDAPPAEVSSVPAYNPHSESPSIRRTNGVNHSKSEPITRKGVLVSDNQAPGPSLPAATSGTSGSSAGTSAALRPARAQAQSSTNFVNPQTDPGRRIGMPVGGAPSPLANRGGYKPPTMKRPALGPDLSGIGGGQGRMPLSDVSNMTVDVHTPSVGGERTKGADMAIGIDDKGGGDKKRAKLADG